MWINLASALSWAFVFSLAGFLFGKSASLFLEDVSKYEHYLMFALMGLVGMVWVGHMYHAWKLKKPARLRLANFRKIRSIRIGI